MAFKQFQLEDQLITVYKRKGSRSLRLSVTHNGQIRVTIPAWAPYHAGLEFVKSRSQWLANQKPTVGFLAHGQAIGKAHHLKFIAIFNLAKPTTRVTAGEIIVNYASTEEITSQVVQAAAQKACIRALRGQAEALLPQRLKFLAAQHGFTYKSVGVKQLKSRWGSCDQEKNIVLNLFLMQLPWDCIDYVLLHELAHTNVLRHGPDFWAELESVLPTAKIMRKTIRSYQPTLTLGSIEQT